MAQGRLTAMFCFSILCLSVFLSLPPEPLSVSAGPVPSSEVGVTATEDRKGWSTYRLVTEKKKAPKVLQNSRIGHHDRTTVLYDGDLSSRVQMDDIEKDMQPGMWGKRAKVGMGDDKGSKRNMMEWNEREPEDLGTWGEKVPLKRHESQRNSECKRRKESPNSWKIQEKTQEQNQIQKLAAIVVGRLRQEEDWSEQQKLFSILKLLMNKEKCEEAGNEKKAAKTVYAETGKDSVGRSASKTFLD